jgi:hypothetical protein
VLYRRVSQVKRFAVSLLLALSAVAITAAGAFADGIPGHI